FWRMRPGVVAKFRCHRGWTPIRGTSCVDSGYRRRIFGGRRWPEPAARIAHFADHSIRIPCATGSQWKPRVLRDHADHAVCALRHLHRAEFRSLVLVLRNESDPGFSADQNLGRRKSRSRRNQVLSLHLSWKCCHVAFVPGNLFRERHLRLRGSRESWKERLAYGKSRVARVCRNFCWARSKGAAVSVSHLAA